MGIGSVLGKVLGVATKVVSGPLGPLIEAAAPALVDRFLGGKKSQGIGDLVRDARSAGIHPLAALGSPISSNYGTPVGSTATGDAVGDAIAAMRRRGPEKEQAALDAELRRAQIRSENAKADALLAEAQSRTTIQQVRNRQTNSPIDLYVQYRDRDGNVLWGPNPDLPDIEQIPVPAAIHGSDVIVGDPLPPPKPAVVPTPQGILPGVGAYRR